MISRFLLLQQKRPCLGKSLHQSLVLEGRPWRSGIDRCKQPKFRGSGGEEGLGGVSLGQACRSEEPEKVHMRGRGAGTQAPSCLVCRCSRVLMGPQAKAQLHHHLKFSVKSTSSIHQYMLCVSGVESQRKTNPSKFLRCRPAQLKGL